MYIIKIGFGYVSEIYGMATPPSDDNELAVGNTYHPPLINTNIDNAKHFTSSEADDYIQYLDFIDVYGYKISLC